MLTAFSLAQDMVSRAAAAMPVVSRSKPDADRAAAEAIMALGDDITAALRRFDRATQTISGPVIDRVNAFPGMYELDTLARALTNLGDAIHTELDGVAS